MQADRSEISIAADAASRRRGPGLLVGLLWWLYLLGGLAFILLGAFLLIRSPDSIVTMAKIAGITLIVDAVLLCCVAAVANEWRGFYLLAGLIAIAGVAVFLLFEEDEASGLAVMLAGCLGLRGLIDVLVAWGEVSDFTKPTRSIWAWPLLAAGIANVLLALWALITRGDSTTAVLVIVAGQAFARGVATLAVSFRLRVLTR